MKEVDVLQALRELSEAHERKSLAKRLALVYDDIERAISSGASHTTIVEQLRSSGFDGLTLSTFRLNLKRLRKKSANRAPANQQCPSESKRARNTAELKPEQQKPAVTMDVSRPTEQRGVDTRSGGGNALGYDPHADVEHLMS